jgi:hypothetical protein
MGVHKDFQEAVYNNILAQTPRGGSRFPSPVPTCYYGELTEFGARWVAKLSIAQWGINRAVLKAVKDLQKEGRIKFLRRHGYTWVVPVYYEEQKGDEVTDSAGDVPHYYDEL